MSIFRISSVCLVVGLFFSTTGCKNNDPLTSKALEAFQVCDKDSDCVFATNGCCDCANGGEETAVNEAQLEKFRDEFDCDGVACTEVARIPSCGAGSVNCVKGLCSFSSILDQNCADVQKDVTDRINELVDSIDKSCEVDDDCVLASTDVDILGSNCRSQCSVAASPEGKSQLEDLLSSDPELVDLCGAISSNECGIAKADCASGEAKCVDDNCEFQLN